jgi:hypothetical protein
MHFDPEKRSGILAAEREAMKCSRSHQKNDVQGDQAKRDRMNELCAFRQPFSPWSAWPRTESQRLRAGDDYPCLGQQLVDPGRQRRSRGFHLLAPC